MEKIIIKETLLFKEGHIWKIECFQTNPTRTVTQDTSFWNFQMLMTKEEKDLRGENTQN